MTVKLLFTAIFLLVTEVCHSKEILEEHNQLLVVVTSSWDDHQGSLQMYERLTNDSSWVICGKTIPVNLGKRGLAWGKGLHPKRTVDTPNKMEGDGKSPAGIFSLGCAFGFVLKEEMSHLKIDYFQIDEYSEAVDDPQSIYYNHIVNNKEILFPDWRSSEKMAKEPLYAFGLMINHNYPNPLPGLGSAIFMHIWENEDVGTSGCTAMSQEHLAEILSWLDSKKMPVLVQLPITAYLEFQNAWKLP